jgi:hypothetical protein
LKPSDDKQFDFKQYGYPSSFSFDQALEIAEEDEDVEEVSK